MRFGEKRSISNYPSKVWKTPVPHRIFPASNDNKNYQLHADWVFRYSGPTFWLFIIEQSWLCRQRHRFSSIGNLAEDVFGIQTFSTSVTFSVKIIRFFIVVFFLFRPLAVGETFCVFALSTEQVQDLDQFFFYCSANFCTKLLSNLDKQIIIKKITT